MRVSLQKLFDRLSRGMAVEHERVDRFQVALFHPPIDLHLPRRVIFARTQVMDDGNERVGDGASKSLVQANERRIDELVRNQDVVAGSCKRATESRGIILQQMTRIAPVSQRHDVDAVPAPPKMLDQHLIIKIAAGNEAEIAVDDEPNLHDDEVYLA
jgi:hypothetical protein